MGLRRKETPVDDVIQISASIDVYKYLTQTFAHLNREEFWILPLNRSNKIIGKHLISKGGQAGTVADPKIIFKVALEHNAAYIVMAHNHPSGNFKPSDSDNKLTSNMVASGSLLSLPVIDHLIFTDNGYYSYRDEGII